MLKYTYTDSFLGRLATEAREQDAFNYIESIAAFTPEWRDRLIILRVYIAICLEAQKGGDDDVYATKLSSYRKEFDGVLSLAKSSQIDGVTVSPVFPSLSADPSR